MLATRVKTDAKSVDKKLISRAVDKSNLGSGFSKDMSIDAMKHALVAARMKAKEFHNML